MRRITLVFALVMSANLAGCAERQQRAQLREPMLSAAGFLVVLPNTPAKADELNSMTPLKMQLFLAGRENALLVCRSGSLPLPLCRQ